MCNPAVVAALPYIMAAASAVAGGVAAKGAADAQAAYAKAQARDAIERGKQEEEAYRAELSKLLGAQRAAYAASGLSVDSGSALDVLESTAIRGEEDVLTIRTNAERESLGFRNAGAQEKFAGRSALTQSLLSAAATGAQGAYDAGAFARKPRISAGPLSAPSGSGSRVAY